MIKQGFNAEFAWKFMALQYVHELLLLCCVGRQQNDLITYNSNSLVDSYYFRLELLSRLSVAVATLRCLYLE